MQAFFVARTPPDHISRTNTIPSRDTITHLALHAAKWNYIGVALRVVIQLIVQIALARLLGPAEFGYFALCFMVVGIGYLLAEMGLSSALIQTGSLTDSDIQRIWTILLTSGLLGAGILAISSEQLALLLGNSEATTYLQFSSIHLFLQIISSVALALLRRALDFKRIQLAQLAGMIIGQVFIGLSLAMVWHTAWAMLLAWLAQLAISWILMFTKVRHRLIPVWPQGSGHLGWFGVRAFTANIANWLIENLDNLLVTRFFGTHSLGFYAVSYNLVRYPTNYLVTTLQSVLFPASAMVRDNHDILCSAYLAALSLVTLITIPIFFSVAILTEPLILVLYGPEWEEAIAIMQPLALAMPLHAITAVSGPILWGMNRVGTESMLQWLTILCFLGAVFIFGLITPAQLAWIVLGIYFIRAFLLVWAVMHVLSLQPDGIAGCFRGPVILGCIAAISSSMVTIFTGTFHPLVQLGLAVTITLLLSFSLFWLATRWVLTPGLAKVLQHFSSRLPGSLVSRIEAIARENKNHADGAMK